jgi:(4S)-4-hydroxy-5-phosphonooxypentane-2,3-dione isomerase
MGYIARVVYEIRPGHEARAEEALCLLRGHTLAEPGCLAYEPHRDPADASRLFLHEMYVDESAYHAHQSSEHFERYARTVLAEHVIDRHVERYESLAAAPLRR